MRAAIATFQHGDMDALREKYFAEDIRWHFPGRSPLAGDYEGVAQVLESFGRLFELTGGTCRIDIVAGDEHAVVPYTSRAERAGSPLVDRTVLTAACRNGKQPGPGSILVTSTPWMSSGRNANPAPHRTGHLGPP
jgi:uncharacterized protein